ncbi:MAG UNVERIFIED_CONTAM: AAA family ATPase [Paenibacillus polymyxa]|jgi:chromosome partitioning protein
MKVVSIVGMKGGSGKSTVGIHLAVCAEVSGLSSAIIDTDPQGSAYKWFERREAETPSVIREPDPDALPRLTSIAKNNGTDLLIIDTAGKAETVALAACEIADLILVPIRPTQFDLETLGTVKRMARIAEKLDRTWVVISQMPASSTRPVLQAVEGIAAYGLQLSPVRLKTRLDFSDSMASGLTATEQAMSGKAASEANELFKWASEIVDLTVK